MRVLTVTNGLVWKSAMTKMQAWEHLLRSIMAISVVLSGRGRVTVAGKTITKTTDYISGLVFESKLTSPADPSDYTEVLQFVAHEEGRIRFTPVKGATPAKFSYDYFVKDYLGNVRMVLTEEQLTDAYPAATMETASAATEEAIYSNLSATRVAKPSAYPNTPSGNAQVAKVSGSGQKIGPAILLKVMAGDNLIYR